MASARGGADFSPNAGTDVLQGRFATSGDRVRSASGSNAVKDIAGLDPASTFEEAPMHGADQLTMLLEQVTEGTVHSEISTVRGPAAGTAA
jgi:hypothetical protein